MPEKNKRATVEIFFSRSQINGLLYVLDCFIKADETNKYAYFASKLKENILNYGRSFISQNGEEHVVLHLYKNEVATLINLFSFFMSSVIDIKQDYFSEFKAR